VIDMLFRARYFRSTILFFLFLTSLLPLAGAQTIVDVGETTPPQNMILLIFDGMGSSYINPDAPPQALNGAPIRTANTPRLQSMISEGLLIPNVKVPTPKTGPAHSVIITGYSGAEQEMVEYPGATIYDILGEEGFLSIALMHKGDFSNLRSEQDIVLFSESNSIPEPILKIQINNDLAPADLINELENWEQKLPDYLEGTEGLDSYIAYEAWELDASQHIVSFMARSHPDIRYIFTINVGVLDSAGHYRGVDGYLGSIEGFDSSLGPLYAAARSSNTAVVVTADHGMAFKSADSPRGGHASADYFSNEAMTVPLIICSPNVEPGELDQEFGQEVVTPTLLSIMDIPNGLKYNDGEAIPVKDYANLWITSNTRTDVEILQGSEIISSGAGDNSYIFAGLKPKINYIVKVSNGDETLEQAVDLEVDRLVRFDTAVSVADDKGWDIGSWRKRIASVMIFLVIIAGVLVIIRIKD
jgi:2,3-bisphosphoglycerate-independent phosphoglycerate mutase